MLTRVKSRGKRFNKNPKGVKNMNEIWESIIGYEGYYEISNCGRVRSVDRTIYFKNNKGSRFYKGKILKQKYHNGYALVNLNKNKNMETLAVHILVAKHFLENPLNLPVVNHKDGVKSNNNVTNLEWTTQKENNIHAIQNKLAIPNLDGIKKINEEYKVALVCYKNGKFIHKSDCSRNMAKWLIDNNLVKNKNIETVARAIRSFSKNKKKYFGLDLYRLNDSISVFEEKSNIFILKNNEIISSHETSNECASWLLLNGYIKNACYRTVARSIRSAIKEKKEYHKFLFIKTN